MIKVGSSPEARYPPAIRPCYGLRLASSAAPAGASRSAAMCALFPGKREDVECQVLKFWAAVGLCSGRWRVLAGTAWRRC
jgi:hypothetical protein